MKRKLILNSIVNLYEILFYIKSRWIDFCNIKKHPNYLEDDKLLHEWQELIRNTMDGLTAEDHEKDIKKNVGVNVKLKDAIDKV